MNKKVLEDQTMDTFDVRPKVGKPCRAASTIVRCLFTTAVWVATTVLVAPPSFSQVAPGLDTYVGIWRMSLNGKTVGTIQLLKYKDKLTGSVTNGHASIGDGGAIHMHEAPGGQPIVESALSEGVLHFVMAAAFDTTSDFTMTLNGPDKAHLIFYAHNGQTIDFDLRRVSWDENNAMQVQYQ